MSKENLIGIIGGSGLYELDGFRAEKEIKITTPFGEPSDNLLTGRLGEKKLVFLARHGRKHTIMPTEVNFKANIYAMKSLNVTRIISISAVGSMRKELKPGSLGLASQFIDRTVKRLSTFFGEGIVGHIVFAEPTCPDLMKKLAESAEKVGVTLHKDLCYLCIEGPQFNTRAESNMYKNAGADIVGMTNATEAKLAREAEICYATLAMITDYDSWHSGDEAVSVEQVLAVMKKNTVIAKRIIAKAVEIIEPNQTACPCGNAAKNSIITPLDEVPKETLKALHTIFGKYY